MNAFLESERAFLSEQLLGRLATVDAKGQPHVVPVGFRYNPETGTIDIGGHSLDQTKKYRDARANPQVAFVVDELVSTAPWRVRGIEIRGRAEVFTDGGQGLGPGFGGAWIRIVPRRIVSWGLDTDPFHASSRTVD